MRLAFALEQKRSLRLRFPLEGTRSPGSFQRPVTGKGAVKNEKSFFHSPFLQACNKLLSKRYEQWIVGVSNQNR